MVNDSFEHSLLITFYFYITDKSIFNRSFLYSNPYRHKKGNANHPQGSHRLLKLKALY